MGVDPLLMAIEHLPLEKIIGAYSGTAGPHQRTLHALEMSAAALAGSEILVLCSRHPQQHGAITPLSIRTETGKRMGVAATSMEYTQSALWASVSEGLYGPDDLEYVPWSSRHFVLSQFALGRNGIVFNQCDPLLYEAGVLEFNATNFDLITQYIGLLSEGAILNEDFLNLLAMEENESQCQQIARDFFLNPQNDISQIIMFELKGVKANGRTHDEINSKSHVSRMYTTNMLASVYGLKYSVGLLPNNSDVGDLGYETKGRNFLITLASLSMSGKKDISILIDEKVRIDVDFAREIVEAHASK